MGKEAKDIGVAGKEDLAPGESRVRSEKGSRWAVLACFHVKERKQGDHRKGVWWGSP